MKTQNQYRWGFRGTCPINGRSDKYYATIETKKFIIVEDLLAYCEANKEKPIFQEAWTKKLAEKFGVSVTLIGYHRGGVRIKSFAECS